MADDETITGEGTNAKFFTALVTNVVIATVVAIIFMILRPRFPIVYQTRLYNSKAKSKPEVPSKSMFGWLGPTLRFPMKEVGEDIGPDQYVYLRFQQMSVYFFGALAVFNLAVILPINITGDNGVVEFEKLSMSNIPEESDRLYAHMVACFISFALFAKFMIVMWKDMMAMRVGWLEKNSSPATHSLMLLDVPEKLDDDEILRKEFQDLFPGQVRDALVVRDTAEADVKLAERDKAYDTLRKTHLNYEYKKDKKGPDFERPLYRKGGFLCCGGEKVDAIKHWDGELDKTNHELAQMKALPKDNWKSVGAAFVMFNSVADATQAAQSKIFANGYPTTLPNVGPEQIWWPNMGLKDYERSARKVIGRVVTFFLIVFFMIPVAFVQSLTNLENLASEVSFLDGVQDIPQPVKGWIEGFLPPVVLIVFFILLPPICIALCKVQGLPTVGKLWRGAFMKMFYFSVFNIFLTTLLSGSIFSEINGFFSNPTDIPDKLGKGMPGVATFFVNFVLLMGISGPFMMLLAIGPLIVHLLLKRVMDSIGIRMDEHSEPPLKPFKYYQKCPNSLLVFLLVMAFSTLNPVMLVCGMICLGGQFIANKYQFVYMHGEAFQSGGLMWPKLSTQMWAGYLVYNLTMIGVIGVKKQPIASALCIIPLVGAFILKSILDGYAQAYINLSVSGARVCDKANEAKGEEERAALTNIDVFNKPSMLAEDKYYDYEHPSQSPRKSKVQGTEGKNSIVPEEEIMTDDMAKTSNCNEKSSA
eukprot:Nk52_evm23s158 gene=Nk52_evmTU23s158